MQKYTEWQLVKQETLAAATNAKLCLLFTDATIHHQGNQELITLV